MAAEAARLVAEAGGAPGDVVALAVAQEETTFAGARTSAFCAAPDLAIAVDVTFATDQPGIELGQMTKHAMGSGPVIARGTTLHPAVTELLHETAEAEGIAVHRRVAGPRHRHRRRRDPPQPRRACPTGLVSVPLRYMHSPVELVSLADIDGGGRADRRLRPAAGAGHVVRAAERCAAAAPVRHRRHAASRRAAEAHAQSLHAALHEVHGVDARGAGAAMSPAGRTDGEIARLLLLDAGVDGARRSTTGASAVREACVRAYARLLPADR